MTTVTREDVARVVAMVALTDTSLKKADALRLAREVKLLMAKLQDEDATIDPNVFEAFNGNDDRQSVLLGYCSLICSILESNIIKFK